MPLLGLIFGMPVRHLLSSVAFHVVVGAAVVVGTAYYGHQRSREVPVAHQTIPEESRPSPVEEERADLDRAEELFRLLPEESSEETSTDDDRSDLIPVNELAAKAQQYLRDRRDGKTPSLGMPWVRFVLEWELHGRPHTTRSERDELRRWMNHLTDEVRDGLRGKSVGSREYVEALREPLFRAGVSNYGEAFAMMIHYFFVGFGNCQAQSRLFAAIIHDVGFAMSRNQIFGLQTFTDHVQPVVLDRSESGRITGVLDLVSGHHDLGVHGHVFDPALMLWAFLRTANLDTVVPRRDLLLASGGRASHSAEMDLDALTRMMSGNILWGEDDDLPRPAGLGPNGRNPRFAQNPYRPIDAQAGADVMQTAALSTPTRRLTSPNFSSERVRELLSPLGADPNSISETNSLVRDEGRLLQLLTGTPWTPADVSNPPSERLRLLRAVATHQPDGSSLYTWPTVVTTEEYLALTPHNQWSADQDRLGLAIVLSQRQDDDLYLVGGRVFRFIPVYIVVRDPTLAANLKAMNGISLIQALAAEIDQRWSELESSDGGTVMWSLLRQPFTYGGRSDLLPAHIDLGRLSFQKALAVHGLVIDFQTYLAASRIVRLSIASQHRAIMTDLIRESLGFLVRLSENPLRSLRQIEGWDHAKVRSFYSFVYTTVGIAEGVRELTHQHRIFSLPLLRSAFDRAFQLGLFAPLPRPDAEALRTYFVRFREEGSRFSTLSESEWEARGLFNRIAGEAFSRAAWPLVEAVLDKNRVGVIKPGMDPDEFVLFTETPRGVDAGAERRSNPGENRAPPAVRDRDIPRVSIQPDHFWYVLGLLNEGRLFRNALVTHQAFQVLDYFLLERGFALGRPDSSHTPLSGAITQVIWGLLELRHVPDANEAQQAAFPFDTEGALRRRFRRASAPHVSLEQMAGPAAGRWFNDKILLPEPLQQIRYNMFVRNTLSRSDERQSRTPYVFPTRIESAGAVLGNIDDLGRRRSASSLLGRSSVGVQAVRIHNWMTLTFQLETPPRSATAMAHVFIPREGSGTVFALISSEHRSQLYRLRFDDVARAVRTRYFALPPPRWNSPSQSPEATD